MTSKKNLNGSSQPHKPETPKRKKAPQESATKKPKTATRKKAPAQTETPSAPKTSARPRKPPRVKAPVALDVATAAAEPSPEHAARRTDHVAPSTRDTAPSTKHRTRSTEHGAPSTEHAAPSTEHRAPSTQHSAPSTTAPSSIEPSGARGARLRVLMVTSEAHPFAKTGGLAEVAGALPAALAHLGHAVTVVLPRYRGVAAETPAAMRIELPLGPRTFSVGFVEQSLHNGVRAVLVDVPELFDRPGLYGVGGHDFPDNALRFAVLSRAALEYARLQGERLDVIHAHDWQAGLVPVYQKMYFPNDPIVGGVPVVFTIHNLAFQGIFGPDALPAIGLGWDVFRHEALEHWGNISLLKGGVNFSEHITTVSPTYAREILTPEFGFGMDSVLRRRANDLVGIVNGIDVERWNPAADPFSPHYSSDKLSGKREAKRALLEEVRLPSDAAALQRPIIGLISRLTDQKGFDLIAGALDSLLALDATWVMLGSGEPHYEQMWRQAAATHPARVSATIGFNERLAHLIEAGADIFLMPSRFEPCGLNQLYSLRYGTVPVVRATGGLDDTVIDADQPGGNGIKFADPSPGALLAAVRRALELFGDRNRWQALQRAGMAGNPSWDVSARGYVKVYVEAEQQGHPHGI
jgi:starch synthase